MKLMEKNIETIATERSIYNHLLSLDNKHILELGCGKAEKTRDIAENGVGRRIVATEVDTIQHEKNLKIKDLPNVTFLLAGAQSLPFTRDLFDVAFMFKSLHHVPVDLIIPSLKEIRRVLKPGGFLYITEPVFAGEFNEILSTFHNEESVRIAAFEGIKSVVEENLYTLKKELFYNFSLELKDFDEFERKFIHTTHTRHHLTDETYHRVRALFTKYSKALNGTFLTPVRVDLLQKQP